MTAPRLAAIAALSFMLSGLASAQSPPAEAAWTARPLADGPLARDAFFTARKESYRALRLDEAVLAPALNAAPPRGSVDPEKLPVIELPRPDGSLAAWRVESSPTLDERLAKRFPSIRSYRLTTPEGGVAA